MRGKWYVISAFETMMAEHTTLLRQVLVGIFIDGMTSSHHGKY